MPGLDVVTLPDGNLRIARTHGDEHLLIECPPEAVLRLAVAEIDRAGVVEAVHFDSLPHTGSPAVAAAAGIVAAGPATKDRR